MTRVLSDCLRPTHQYAVSPQVSNESIVGLLSDHGVYFLSGESDRLTVCDKL